MWALVFPEAEIPTDLPQHDTNSLQKFAVELAHRFHPALREMVATSDPDYTRLSRFSSAKRPASWDRRRATLMGDAVHVMPPFGAHGGNTALRDAALLAGKLQEASAAQLPLESAFADYRQEMEDYAFKAVAAADRSMRQLEMNPILRWLMLKVLTRFHRVRVPLRG
jgi:2-polyprenyl-6-methoxyphenol hydroxylase-like FAD-dependent oxidoreductase